MTNVLKTIGILNIAALCTVGMIGCSHDRERHVERHHHHDYGEYEYRERTYGQAYFGPEMTRTAKMDANMAAATMADEHDHDSER